MGRAVEQWMPMYWGDYLKKTARFTLAHHGAYMLLIAEYWTSGKPIPADPEEQALIARIPTKEWLRLRPKIADKFDEKGGLWHHERVDRELAKAEATHTAKAKAGAEGAAKRWQKDSTVIAEPSASQSQNDAPLPSPLPSPNGEKDISPDEKFGQIFDDQFWPAYPSRGQAQNPKKPARLKFIAICKRGEDPEAIIAAVKAYAANPTTKVGSEFVKTAEVWLGKECWKDQPAQAVHVDLRGPIVALGRNRVEWEVAYRAWLKFKQWPWNAGPNPSESGCQCPRDVIDEVGNEIPEFLARPKPIEAA